MRGNIMDKLKKLKNLFTRKNKKDRNQFANNTAVLNDTPKNHKPSRVKIVKK